MRSRSLLISAAGSGHGKSVVTMGLLQAMKQRGIRLQSFKCGPDYIDPGFHERVLGIPCRNLDTFLMGADEVQEEVSDAEQSGLFAVCEGAMGLYDGLGGGISHSAYNIAVLCRISVLAVLDAGRRESCAVQLEKLLERDFNGLIKGVLINRCTGEMYPEIIRELNTACERRRRELRDRQQGDRLRSLLSGRSHTEETGLSQTGVYETKESLTTEKRKGKLFLCGFLPPMREAELSSRHLGLVEAAQVDHLSERVQRIASSLEESGVVDHVLALTKNRPDVEPDPDAAAVPDVLTLTKDRPDVEPDSDRMAAPDVPAWQKNSGRVSYEKRKMRCRIAVAKDEAFSFLYQRSLENLERAGADPVFFSPLHDAGLPDGTQGLYLPGGYPELYAPLLEKNISMRRAVKQAVMEGMPTVAECGGFLYLGQELWGEDGRLCRMTGVLPGSAARCERLVRFGYLELTQEKGDSLLFREGESVPAHEFHYWDSDCCGEDLYAEKRTRGTSWRCGFTGKNLYAAFPHLYLNQERADRFVRACVIRSSHKKQETDT